MKRIIIGQAGGPTTVINATLAGITDALKDYCELIFVQNGYEGLSNENYIEGDRATLEWIKDNKNIPGACLGSGRFQLEEKDIEHCVKNLQKLGADGLVFIGGNGTMEALSLIEENADKLELDLQVIGLPKTVDNDLSMTDHAPGFPSAAKYVAQATLDMSRDLYSMKNFEQVRILETMGRNSGWLAAASGLYKKHSADGPHFIAIPEEPLDPELLLKAVKKALEESGCAIIVVSEGVNWQEGFQIERKTVNGRQVLGGVSSEIEKFIQSELDVVVRSELLGMNQRSSVFSISNVDQKEAYNIGIAGGEWVLNNRTGVMASILRSNETEYNIDIIPVGLKEVVSKGESPLPEYFIKKPESYYKWLEPMIGSEIVTYPSPDIEER